MPPSPDSLPECVRQLEVDGKEIYLLGTAHVSRQSVADVATVVETLKPDTVCVELCEARFVNLTNRDSWRKLDIFKVLREGKAMLLLSSLIITSFQRRIADQLGVHPGAEMVEGIEQAQKLGANLVLADRDIQITLKRTWAHLNLWNKLKMMSQLFAGLLLPQKIDAETIEQIKQEDELADVMETLAKQFPRVKETLIDERDVYLAQEIRGAKGAKLVAVVGAGHVPGILREIQHQTPLDSLREVPPPAAGPKIFRWAIPAAVVALLIYGFFTGGAEHSFESVGLWFLVNGALSALGAALALGHPLTILVAALAAPLTSLNPMIAAGWVAGLAQAWIKKPTVEDLEELPQALASLKGFWGSPVIRILLVVALANLGSILGTFIAGSWIAARSL